MNLRTCLIPAAGKGIRARPQTELVPKAMLQVGGKPVLQNTIEMIRDQLGITSFVIVIGHLGKTIADYFKNGKHLNVSISYVQNDSVNKGLAWSVYLGRDQVEDEFLVILGDEFYQNSNHFELKQHPLNDKLAICGVLQEEKATIIEQNYSVECSGKRIYRIHEKPDKIIGNLMGTGTFVLSSDIFPHILTSYEESRQNIDFLNMLDSLCRADHKIEKFILSGNYVNINNIKDLRRANTIALKENS